MHNDRRACRGLPRPRDALWRVDFSSILRYKANVHDESQVVSDGLVRAVWLFGHNGHGLARADNCSNGSGIPGLLPTDITRYRIYE